MMTPASTNPWNEIEELITEMEAEETLQPLDFNDPEPPSILDEYN